MTDQQPGWGPPPPPPPPRPPRPPLTAARVFTIMVGGLLGGILGIFAPLLPAFLYVVLTGREFTASTSLYQFMLVVTVPAGVVLGALWARQKTR
jgi:predicted lipid-binding transport protein (Tim44 family)